MKPEAIGRIAYDAWREGVYGVEFDAKAPAEQAAWIRAGQAAFNKGVSVGSRVVGFKQYPSIPILREDSPIFGVKEVICLEKLHGSGFRVGFPLGMLNLDEVRYGSREVDFDPESKVKFPLPHAITWFKSRPELLAKMWETLKSYGFNDCVVFGEAFGPGINAKGVRYAVEGDQRPLFRCFGIMVGDNFLTYDLLVEVTDKMGLTRAPLVYRGPPTMEAFNALLNQPSIAAKENGVDDPTNFAEGIVIQTNPLMRDVFGNWLIAKHKGTKFSEVAHAPAVKKERVESPADAFAAMYVTEGRVSNALGRLRDRGVALKGTMQDVPLVLAEVLADLHKECQADWPEGVDDKGMTGSVSRVMGPILRTLLAG